MPDATPHHPQQSARAADSVRAHLASIRVRDLENYLSEQDTPCPVCDYNLRGHKGGRCPECGSTLTTAEPRGIAHRTALISCALGALLQGIAILLCLVRLFMIDGPGHASFARLGIAGGAFVVDCGAVIVLLAAAPSFRQMTRMRRRLWAFAACLATLAGLALVAARW